MENKETKQCKVVIKDNAIKGLRGYSTIWFDADYFYTQNKLKKYEHLNDGIEVLTRTILKNN